MYRDSESYSVVKKILLASVPHVEVLKTREENEILVVVNRQKKLFLLNEVAKDFLLLCDGKRRLNEIIDELGEIYDVEKNSARRINILRRQFRAANRCFWAINFLS